MTAAILALADGSVFHGTSIGITGETLGEVVFNTAMTGYQEMLTDPSYAKQILTLTYPHVGNVGCNINDDESSKVHAAGLVIHNLSLTYSNWRAEMSLADWLQKQQLIAIADIDTRHLTRILREQGAQNGCIIAGDTFNSDVAIEKARAFAGLRGMDLAKQVGTRKNYVFTEGTWNLSDNKFTLHNTDAYKVVAYDFGIKKNMLRLLVDLGCEMTVVPPTATAAEILALQPDGVFLSNGPGDPEPCAYAIDAIRELLAADIPLFGICLGYQLLALAVGAKTKKMKLGHHGANHPIKDLQTQQVLITSQNHSFVVDADSMPSNVMATHISLFDGSLQGIRLTDKMAFGLQGHPEASPGPHDAISLFRQFIANMQLKKQRNDA